VSFRDWLKNPLRSRDQEIVELAEAGVAPPDEVEWTEEQIAKHRHDRDEAEQTPPSDPPAES
jgi:hypothetical protein